MGSIHICLGGHFVAVGGVVQAIKFS